MGATTAVSIEEYLASSYDPDVDYVDGALEDRNVGEKPHSRLQGKLTHRLMSAGLEWVYPELRLRVAPTRCRIPDLCVYLEEPKDDVPTVPPVLAIEILSPEDRSSRMMVKLRDYIAMGCPCVWVLDPALKQGYVYDGKALIESDELTHPSVPALRVRLSEVL